MSKPSTHVFAHSKQTVPGSDPMPVCHLYRLSDGLRIASAKDALVQFGRDPQQSDMRVFIDHSYALSFMRKLADGDWAVTNGIDPKAEDFTSKAAEYAAVIDDRYAERQVVTAADAMSRRPS